MVCRVKQLSPTVRRRCTPGSRSAKKFLKTLSDTAAQEIGKMQKALNKRVKKYLEKDFGNDVIEEAHLFGWRAAHFPPIHTASGHWLTCVKADGKGWPDLVLLRCKSIIVVELKIESLLRDEQITWLRAFQDAGIPTFVWTPSDWDFIRKTLRDGV